MSDTLTLPKDDIQAVLQECPGISPLEREGIMTKLKARDVTRFRPETTYVLANVTSSFTIPDPRSFDLLEWASEPELPYELQVEDSFHHMVVVTHYPQYAIEFFKLLKSQKGLEIGALEFLILINPLGTTSYVDLPTTKNKLEGSALMNWATGSNSIKIISKRTTVDAQLERHARFVLKRNDGRNLRNLTDEDRTQRSNNNEHQEKYLKQPQIPSVARRF